MCQSCRFALIRSLLLRPPPCHETDKLPPCRDPGGARLVQPRAHIGREADRVQRVQRLAQVYAARGRLTARALHGDLVAHVRPVCVLRVLQVLVRAADLRGVRLFVQSSMQSCNLIPLTLIASSLYNMSANREDMLAGDEARSSATHADATRKTAYPLSGQQAKDRTAVRKL